MLKKKLTDTGMIKVIKKFADKYFQMEVLGDENLPYQKDGNVLFVMNHTAFFGLEVYLLGTHLLTRDAEQQFKTLVWEGFVEGPAAPWFKALGCEKASIEGGANMLKSHSALIMPEGVGATDVRNRFNKFHTGYLRIAKKAGVPIVPIGFFGVDESIPWLVGHNRFLAEKLMKPVDPTFDFVMFPKLPVFRPTKIVFNVGKPIVLKDEDLDTEDKVHAKNAEIKNEIARLVDEAELYRTQAINSSKVNTIFHRIMGGKTTLLSEPPPKS